MGVFQGVQDWSSDAHGEIEVQGSVGPEHVGQGDALDERHHVEDQALAFADEVHRHRMGMAQLGQRAGFLLEPGKHALGPVDVGPQHLHREAALELGVEHFIDFRKPAPSHQPHDHELRSQCPAQLFHYRRDRFSGRGQQCCPTPGTTHKAGGYRRIAGGTNQIGHAISFIRRGIAAAPMDAESRGCCIQYPPKDAAARGTSQEACRSDVGNWGGLDGPDPWDNTC